MVTDHHSSVSLLYWFNCKEEFACKMSTQVLYLIDFVALQSHPTAVNVLSVFCDHSFSPFVLTKFINFINNEDRRLHGMYNCRLKMTAKSSGQSRTTTWELEDQLKQQMLQIWSISWAMRRIREDPNNISPSLSHRIMLLKIVYFWMWKYPHGVSAMQRSLIQ